LKTMKLFILAALVAVAASAAVAVADRNTTAYTVLGLNETGTCTKSGVMAKNSTGQTKTNSSLTLAGCEQTCDALGKLCGGFVRNTGKYKSDQQTHCFLYPVADIVGSGQTVVKCPQGNMFLKPNVTMPTGGCAAPPPPPPVW